MSAPPGLLAAALLFWGWQTGLLALSLPCAVVAEGWRLTSRRLDFSRADFARVSDFCAALFFCLAAYCYFTRPANAAFMMLSALLPLVLMPMLASQLYSARGVLDVRALFVFMRRWPEKPEWTADISYPFLLYVLIAAAAANTRSPWFYPALVALASWGLRPARPKGAAAGAWVAALALSGALGFAGQRRLSRLQTFLETRAIELVFGGPRGGIDPQEAATSLGHVGRLKLSGRIALRMTVPPGEKPPRLLRAASYDAYRGRRWLAWDSRMSPTAFADGGWLVGKPAGGAREVGLAVELDGGSGLLPRPAGAFVLRGFAGGVVVRNPLGALRLEQGPGLATYRAAFGPGGSSDEKPGPRDLEVPAGDAALLGRLAREHGLDARRPRAAVDALASWFARDFRYSLYREGPDPGAKALDEFLTKTRAGHCEYFATATALLLRAAGIPARYAAGYSIQEYSPWERAWLARDRHAHAWAQAWIDGSWVDVDLTPASWVADEGARAPWWEPLRDAGAWLSYRIARWRWSQAERSASERWVWLLALLVIVAAWRFAPSFRAAVAKAAARPATRAAPDSPWYAIERRLASDGLGREASETWRAWLARVKRPELARLLELHQRARFDPRGITRDEREALAAGATAWLAEHRPPRGG